METDGVAVLYLGKVGGSAIEIAAGDRSLTVDLANATHAWGSITESLLPHE